jgi:hypothetical protein
MGIALSGYFYLTTRLITKFRVPKFQGYHLIYRALVHGLVFFVLSFLIYYCSFPLFSQSSFLIDTVISVFPNVTQAQFNLYVILLNSILFSYIGARGMNLLSYWLYNFAENYGRRPGKELSSNTEPPVKTRKRSIKETGKSLRLAVYSDATNDTFMRHILECFIKARMLMVTLESRKCYVGYPNEIRTPTDGDKAQELTLLPVSTGYRHEGDLCLELTTNYEKVMYILAMAREEINNASDAQITHFNETLDSYRITIPFSQIVTMTTFDLSQYTGFKEMEGMQRDGIYRRRNGASEPPEVVINEKPSPTILPQD